MSSRFPSVHRVAALTLPSVLVFVALMFFGTLWFIVTVNGIYTFVPWWLSHFRRLPWNLAAILATFDCIVIVLLMLPWGALCAWACWIIEGAWLDLLDPNGRIATGKHETSYELAAHRGLA